MEQPRTPVVTRGVNVPKAPPKDAKSRRFSKLLTVAAMVGTFATAWAGLWLHYPQTPDLIAEIVVGCVLYLLIYMGVGHMDFRAVLGRNFGEVITALLGRRKKPDSTGYGFPPPPGGGLD